MMTFNNQTMASRSVKNITLLSSNCDELEVTVGAVMQSELFRAMLEACSDVIGKVPLYGVTTPLLVKVMEYCQKHTDYEAANGGRALVAAAVELEAWDVEFVKNEELDMVLDILMAASDLNIQGSVDLCYETMADLIKEKSLEKIQQIFGEEKIDALALQGQERIRRQNQYNGIIIL